MKCAGCGNELTVYGRLCAACREAAVRASLPHRPPHGDSMHPKARLTSELRTGRHESEKELALKRRRPDLEEVLT